MSLRPPRRYHLLPLALLLSSTMAHGLTVETGDPDLGINWTNKFTFNTGWRTSPRDPAIARNASYDEGEYLFDKGDMVAKRFDLFSEFDLNYRQERGFRISAALWYDPAYGDSSQANPTITARNISGGRFDSYVKRYYRGPSGEFMDAFVWSNFEMANGWDANVKIGRHALIWGVGLIGNAHAVSYAQAPNDGLKSAQSPGASAKETALPINQFSGTLQVADDLSFSAYRTFEWRPSRMAEAGTYYSASDVILASNTTVAGLRRADMREGRGGDWGLSMQWRPRWAEGVLGLYYRQFDDKAGWAAQPDFANGRYFQVVPRDVRLLGVSLNRSVGWLSLGTELSYRQNGALNTRSFASSGAPLFEGAVGNTWHALVNGLVLLNQTTFWDTMSLTGELQYSRLSHVSRNGALYKVEGSAGCSSDPISVGCSTRDAWVAALAATPQWQQVWPGIDLEMPLTYISHLKGNAPSVGGGSQGMRLYKIGLSAKIYARHQVDVAFTAYSARQTGGPGGLVQLNPLLPLVDRDTLTATYRYDF